MSDTLRVVPLGGLGEVGMNCMSLECGDQRLLVDCGVTFPDLPLGSDVIRPDFSHLAENPLPHSALWVTHGHEDHIGAVAFLLREHPMPVYAPPYAMALIRDRLEEYGVVTDDLHEIAPGQRVGFGPLTAEPVRVTHSIADATALALDTPVGRVIHTGDFKIDPDPTDGEEFDGRRFRALGDAGVRLLLSDSTNSDSDGNAGAEADVAEALEERALTAKGRLVIALFGSNTHRLRSVIAIARACRRKLCLIGRSVQSHARVAAGTGYLDDADDILISPDQAARLEPHRVLIACTGTQGEAPAGLARLASNAHPAVSLSAGDTVIVSARVIPGRERAVHEIINRLERRGVHVTTGREHREIHVSGHAKRAEQQQMLELVRPETFIPVHGTFYHLLRHSELARELGVPTPMLIENGDVVELGEHDARVVASASVGRVHVCRGQDLHEQVMLDRALLARQGMAVVTIAVRDGKLVSEPQLLTRGVLYEADRPEALDEARQEVAGVLRAVLRKDPHLDEATVRDTAKRALARYFVRELGIRVMAYAMVCPVDT